MPTVLRSLQSYLCPVSEKFASYVHSWWKAWQTIFTSCKVCKLFAPVGNLHAFFARFLKTLPSFYTVSEEFANFLKSSQLQEKKTKLDQARVSPLARGLQPPEPLAGVARVSRF